jgi:hypothetical protein
MDTAPAPIRTEADVLAVLLSYLQLHYIRVANTEDLQMFISVDPAEMAQIVAVLARAKTMREIQP